LAQFAVDLAGGLAAAVDVKGQRRYLASLLRRLRVLGLAEQAAGEELLQTLPALLGHEVSLRGRVLLAVCRLETHHPPKARVVLVVLVVEEAEVAHPLPDAKVVGSFPGELLSLRRGVECLNHDQFVAGLRFQDNAHRSAPHGKLSSPWWTAPSGRTLVCRP